MNKTACQCITTFDNTSCREVHLSGSSLLQSPRICDTIIYILLLWTCKYRNKRCTIICLRGVLNLQPVDPIPISPSSAPSCQLWILLLKTQSDTLTWRIDVEIMSTKSLCQDTYIYELHKGIHSYRMHINIKLSMNV